MRHRKPIEKLTQIKNDPDIRVTFPAQFYKGYFGLNQIAIKHHLNIAVMARHITLVWEKKFKEGTEEVKDWMLTQVLQSIHGVEQLSILNGAAPAASVKHAALNKALSRRKGAFVGKKRKLESKSAR